MKRPSSSDSLVGARTEGLISLYTPVPDENNLVGRVGSFQSLLDGCVDEDEEMTGDGEDMCSSLGAFAGGGAGEKKRRLSVDQVKALEKNFELENKLEPERKVKLAQELGLQPRQVAVWFQNRRARWKTKQLERDYGVLKGNYEALKLNHEHLQLDNEALRAEIKALKAKLSGDENISSHCSLKEEPIEVERGKVKPMEEMNAAAEEMIVGELEEDEGEGGAPALVYKDGSSDSDSSAILNDENSSPHHVGGAGTASPSGAISQEYQFQEEQPHDSDLFHGFTCSSSSSLHPPPPFNCPNGKGSTRFGFPFYFESQPQIWKVEESGVFDGEEPCGSSFFSDDQAPTLPWYCSDQWD